jgi:hypothetical protein
MTFLLQQSDQSAAASVIKAAASFAIVIKAALFGTLFVFALFFFLEPQPNSSYQTRLYLRDNLSTIPTSRNYLPQARLFGR